MASLPDEPRGRARDNFVILPMKSPHQLLCFLILFQISIVIGFTGKSFQSQPLHLRSGTATNEINLSTEQEMILQHLSIERCCYPFNETVYNFYRYNFDKKRSKKRVPSLPKKDEDNDAVYLYRTPNGMVLAALRLTRSKNDSKYIFLRSLCVSRDYRRQRLAMRFLEEALANFSPDPSSISYCYCFASPYLEGMYRRGGFTRIEKSEMAEHLPKWLIGSYNAMDEKWSRKTLGMFIKKEPHQEMDPEPDAHQVPIHVVLLQHRLEFAKPTATGWLLDDKLYFDKYKEGGEDLSTHLHVDRWVWHGRNDTEDIENRLSFLRGDSVLLWTGGSDSEEANVGCLGPNKDAIPKTFIILDGTWQQAKKMYRRIPALWRLPRLCLRDVPPSKYILRGDSGWKDRFGATIMDDEGSSGNSNESSLLCTAEVVAALLDLQDYQVGSTLVRSRLDSFQTNFLARK